MPLDPNPSRAKQSSGLPAAPNDNPVDLPTQGNAPDGGAARIKTVGAPLIPSGDVSIVPPPVVLANSPAFDPANPGGAPRQEIVHRSDERKALQKELDALRDKQHRAAATRDPYHALYNRDEPAPIPTEADHRRAWELHYLVNGEPVPAG